MPSKKLEFDELQVNESVYMAVDFIVRFLVEPGEPRTWDYPGSPATIEIEKYEILTASFVNEDGEDVNFDMSYVEIVELLKNNEEKILAKIREE